MILETQLITLANAALVVQKGAQSKTGGLSQSDNKTIRFTE